LISSESRYNRTKHNCHYKYAKGHSVVGTVAMPPNGPAIKCENVGERMKAGGQCPGC
jgi:hypothetical protein